MSVTSLIIASLIFTGLINNDEAPLAAESFAREALKYLIETQGFETARLVYVEKPRKGKVRVKLLLVPPGAALPN